MGLAWKDFEMPKRLILDESTATDTYGKFIAEPFERGYGLSVGNLLRRVLISSIEGYAVTSVKFDGALHEFSTIPGVLEDTTEIILNIKKLIIQSTAKTPKNMYIKATKKGEVKAKDIVTDETASILNKNLHLATLNTNTKFNVEMTIAKGRGYVSSEKNKAENQSIGVIPIDSAFSPVTRVNFAVEDTRVGQITDYDKLLLEVWTNGSMSPTDALLYASNIGQKHMDIFVNFGELPEEVEEEQEEKITEDLIEKLRMPVSELELSVRSSNCLREAKINTIVDLVKRSESEMLKYRNFGKKSLTEIGQILKTMDLNLGMKLDKEVLKRVKEK